MNIYARTKKFKNKDGSIREYLYLVESVWVPEKKSSRQKNICCLGRIDSDDIQKTIDNILKNISKYSERLEVLDICKDINITSNKTYGEILIFRKLWKELNFDGILKYYYEKGCRIVDITEAVFAMVCNRLIEPGSKRGTYYWKEDVYCPEWDDYSLHHFYRSLDFLVEHKEEIEKDYFFQVRDLFSLKVNVMMFDTTSISYWGEGKKAKEFLAHGYPKNKRFDLKQLVIGIVMDQQGMPLAHEVWEGNKSDKPAFKEVIDKIKEKYEIDKVILVADRGMISEENIKYLEEKGYEYILGVKMRQLEKLKRGILLSDEGFEKLQSSSLKSKEISEKELIEKIEEIKEKNRKNKKKKVEKKEQTSEEVERLKARRWITCLNEIVAIEDKRKRAYFRKILENKIEFSTAKEWIVKNGYKKYVNIDKMQISLNEDKLNREELYDGKWVLVSNSKLSISDLVSTYKDLSKIERHFRDLKSELEVGPVYLQKEKRIRGHIFVCFLALQIKTVLKMKLKEATQDHNYSEIMRDVAKIKANEYSIKDKKVLMRTDLQGVAHLAFKAVKTKIPSKIISREQGSHVPTSQDLFEKPL